MKVQFIIIFLSSILLLVPSKASEDLILNENNSAKAFRIGIMAFDNPWRPSQMYYPDPRRGNETIRSFRFDFSTPDPKNVNSTIFKMIWDFQPEEIKAVNMVKDLFQNKVENMVTDDKQMVITWKASDIRKKVCYQKMDEGTLFMVSTTQKLNSNETMFVEFYLGIAKNEEMEKKYFDIFTSFFGKLKKEINYEALRFLA